MAKTKNIDTANQIKCSGKAWAESDIFSDYLWILLTILDQEKYYTQAEVDQILKIELERTVG